jgi:secreted PhoX family phosphatase
VKDRNIDNSQGGLTRLNAKQYDVILEALSRRKFLRTSSAALAMTALAGATALRGQERSSTAAAEHDHSSSDPGQENDDRWRLGDAMGVVRLLKEQQPDI